MESTNSFYLQDALRKWQEENLQRMHLTKDDQKELTEHFNNTIEDLRDLGLTDEEAFAVAKIRLGGYEHWGKEFINVSDDNFQIKKVVNIFFGVFLYFICYFGIILFINSLFLSITHFTEIPIESTLMIIKKVWSAIYILVVLSIFSLFVFRKKLIPVLKKIQLNFGKVIIAFFVFASLLVGERYTVPQIANVMKGMDNSIGLRNYFYMSHQNFEYWFPLLITFCFLILFLLYRKKKYV